MRRRLFVALLTAHAFFISGCVMDRLFLFPERHVGDHPSRHGLVTEEVAIQNSEGNWISGWFVRGQGERKGALLLLHGNGGNLAHYLDYLPLLSGAGYDVLAIDYQGYGASQGPARVRSLPGDVAAGLAWLRARPDVPRDRIGIYGVSLGTALAISAARRDGHIRALVLEGGYLPLLHFYRVCGGCFLSWPFAHLLHWLVVPKGIDAEADLKELDRAPALFITGEADTVTPVWMAREMYAMKPGEKQIWTPPGIGHCLDPLNGAYRTEYRKRVLEFLDRAFGTATSR